MTMTMVILRRGSTMVVGRFVVVIITTTVFGNDGSGSCISRDGDALAWFDMTICLESVCNSLVGLCLFSP